MDSVKAVTFPVRHAQVPKIYVDLVLRVTSYLELSVKHVLRNVVLAKKTLKIAKHAKMGIFLMEINAYNVIPTALLVEELLIFVLLVLKDAF
mmetsp:Transcript_32505/g.5886  ORF Transcript_32505/g.5886 Transcript_32505/m.5886 type:complete len:92 (+) Transcript_32505:1055-1330(+)